jgi:hypothetical protein
MSQDEHRIFGQFACCQTLSETAVLDRRHEGKDATHSLCEKIFSTPPFMYFTSLADGFESLPIRANKGINGKLTEFYESHKRILF